MLLLNNFWQLFMLSAPWLMLGLFIAGLINVYLPKDFLNRHLGSEGLYTTIKAAIIGAPMPLCSCGVIPAALALRRSGASKSATTAFLVSTPETGIDSISVSYVLLGPFMAIIRPIAAITSAIVAGVLVGQDSDKPPLTSHIDSHSNENVNNDSECCASKKEQPVETASCCSKEKITEEKESCCANANSVNEKLTNGKIQKSANSSNSSIGKKLHQAISFSCTKLLQDTAKWLMIGLFFAALVQTYVPVSFFTQWGSGILAMVVVILISIPMYVCATASTPIAAGLLLSGVSPGAVLVFMLAGPATNIATLGVVASELGKRAIVSYLTGVIGTAILFGLLTDYLVEEYNIEVAPMLGEHHEVLPVWFSQLSALLLAGLLIRLVILHIKKPL
ncbi:MAG: SO_0444 family Cu/Zn efflux transporter [Alteromonadaceae bacterium]|nr:SO_0444 family Cu/Zn efflux transporter [Alteromonadaceae bacterium]